METTSHGENSEESRAIATLYREEHQTVHASAVTESADDGGVRCASRLDRHGKSGRKRKPGKRMEIGCCSGEESDEKSEVDRKIEALQKIVPGGESLCVDKLFEETAEYILQLQYQVKALRFLSDFVQGAEKEKRKLAG